MTPDPGHPRSHLIVGAGSVGRNVRDALHTVGITDVVILDEHVVSSVFDDADSSWVLHTAGGQAARAEVVIAADRSIFFPWIPDLPGSNDFRGESFPASAWVPDFDPSGKRIAVVGTDAAAGHFLGLIESARSVTVFAHSPRRVVTEVPLLTTRARRWLGRRASRAQPRPAVEIVRSPIAAVTPDGIHTNDGTDHPADAVIYGTGLTLADHVGDQTLVGNRGLTIRQAWTDGLAPFFGVAVHGFPNYFFVTGPDFGTQIGYLTECLALRQRTGSKRIEVRRSSQQVFHERAHLGPAVPPAVLGAFETFDLSGCAPEDDDTYDGAATLELVGTRHPVRVRLRGHLDPLDGNYHWQGTVLDALPKDSVKQARSGTLSVGHHSAPARIVEQTPWGSHTVAGIGAPPYPRSGA